MVDGLIDTGFTASLALSPTLATSLGLVPLTRTEATLADGATRLFEVCPVEVYWTNGWTSTLATIIGNEVLIGMSLLWGCELRLVAEDGGVVEIRAKP